MVLAVPAASEAGAPTFTVNSTGDAGDGTPEGTCDSDPTGGVTCTLREAIQESNFTLPPDRDTIQFNIPGSDPGHDPLTGVFTIQPATELPQTTTPVLIDGYTQPTARVNTFRNSDNAVILIEIDGSAAPAGADGLEIAGGATTVRGLAIHSFTVGAPTTGNAIFLPTAAGNTNNVIEGNFIGTDASGKVAPGNGGLGVRVNTPDNRIGGASLASRNIISGNEFGIGLQTAQTNRNLIARNFIGTGTTRGRELGNVSRGISITNGASNNLITDNVVAYNGGGVNGDEGLRVFSGTGNTIFDNSFFANDAVGIELDPDGRTAGNDDPNDLDTGANNQQNMPIVTSAKTKGARTTIKGTLNSTPSETFTIEFFENAVKAFEGERLVGEKRVVTDVEGDAAFRLRVPKATGFITATATDESTGDTSEFSNPRRVKHA